MEVLQALLAKWALEMADEKSRVFSFEQQGVLRQPQLEAWSSPLGWSLEHSLGAAKKLDDLVE